jgi:IS5 family transposase
METSKSTRKRAGTPKYVSPNQLTIAGFETPFEQQLTSTNRWVLLSKHLPWDKIVTPYDMQFRSAEGRPPISGRIVLGALIIKHMLSLTDRETIQQIQENVFMQYFLGYSSFTNEAPFSPSLFVEIRERLNLEILNNINDIIIAHSFEKEQTSNTQTGAVSTVIIEQEGDNDGNGQDPTQPNTSNDPNQILPEKQEYIPELKNEGKLLMDATVAPQNITFPTDLKLLNAARIKSEELIDKLYKPDIHQREKPRTYRDVARKDFLNTAKKKGNTAKAIYKANGTQLRYLKRNLGHITDLLLVYKTHGIATKLKQKDIDYLQTLELILHQQQEMFTSKSHRVADRIVNLHQPHVRPIVRGKDGKKVEFGSKLQVSLVKGFALLDKLSWDNFNEGQYLQSSVENYRKRFGFYPEEVLADQIYCNRENRKWLKNLGVKLRAKPLGRPSAEALSNPVSPGERNPIEGKFGQAKVKYGLANIGAKLKSTSESWVATIILVLNLVNMTRLNLMRFIQNIISNTYIMYKHLVRAEFLSKPYLLLKHGTEYAE